MTFCGKKLVKMINLNLPDGVYFRKEGVDVLSPFKKGNTQGCNARGKNKFNDDTGIKYFK